MYPDYTQPSEISHKMDLSDLPVELLVKVLPIEKNLLHFPKETIIPWLNLLPQVKSFRILGNSGVGYKRLQGETIEDKIVKGQLLPKYGRCVKTTQECVAKANELFQDRIFIKTGGVAYGRDYRKFVIFEFDIVGHLIRRYGRFSSSLLLWMDDSSYQKTYLVNPYLLVLGTKTILLDPRRLNVFPSKVNFIDSWLARDCHLTMDILDDSCSRFRNLVELELNMAVDIFIKMRSYKSFLEPIAPRRLTLYFNAVRKNLANKDEKSRAPIDFPIDWVLELCIVGEVEQFSLHYFDRLTTIIGLGQLLQRMPFLKNLCLSFGKLHYDKIPKMLLNQKHDVYMDVMVDKAFFYNSFDYDKSFWKIKIEQTVVFVSRTWRHVRGQPLSKWCSSIPFRGTYRSIRYKATKRKVEKSKISKFPGTIIEHIS
ncbi:hypothetical protein I9W82_000610 [Candida metapsilosis]|uniref:Uncharacterized protein n=1 Tax=Candida metapsilosis TaxID=273372 RepID=A0A8H8DD53_9ASCO|nr:hypothetical protein I9W82_000610 [Candida metapsilosis]